MNKYEVMVKIEEIKRLAAVRQFEGALQILQKLDVRLVKKSEDIMTFIEIYMQTGMYAQAKELMLHVYKKHSTRKLLSKLIYVSIKLSELDSAEEFYEEYIKMAPKDVNRYIFRYKIDKAKKKDYDTLIESLVALKQYDYIEEWAYELAKNYHRAGYISKCIKECSDIILWFGHGVTVEKAKMLRAYHLNNAAANEEFEEDETDFSATVELNEILKKVRNRLNKSSESNNMSDDVSEYERDFTTNISAVEEEYARDYDEIGQNKNIEETLRQLYNKEVSKADDSDYDDDYNDDYSQNGYANKFHSKSKSNTSDEYAKKESFDEVDLISDAIKEQMKQDTMYRANRSVKNETKKEQTDSYERALEKELRNTQTGGYEQELKEELKKLDKSNKNKKEFEDEIGKDSFDDSIKDNSFKKDTRYKEEYDEGYVNNYSNSFSDDDDETYQPAKKYYSRNTARNRFSEEYDTDSESEENDDEVFSKNNSTKNVSKDSDIVDSYGNDKEYDTSYDDSNIYENIYENEYDNYDYIELNPDIFCNFYDIDYINYNIRKVIYNIHVNIMISNIILTGPKSTGKTTLAKMISKQLFDMGYVADNKIARISGDVFNKVNLLKKSDKLIDGCMIIQDAEKITSESFDRLIRLIDLCKGRLVVFLETTLDANEIFAKNERLQSHFISILKMPYYNVDELIGFAHSYATSLEYYISEGADYALKNYFSKILKNRGGNCELSTVIKVIDNAMASVKRRNQYSSFDVMNRRYRDNRGSNVIEERDI